jgi:hypothetical protein
MTTLRLRWQTRRSDSEIQPVTAHKALQMVQKYRAQAGRCLLSKVAQIKRHKQKTIRGPVRTTVKTTVKQLQRRANWPKTRKSHQMLFNDFSAMVRVKGLEPPRQRRQNLNLVRLPIPPHPHGPVYQTPPADATAKICNFRDFFWAPAGKYLNLTLMGPKSPSERQ